MVSEQPKHLPEGAQEQSPVHKVSVDAFRARLETVLAVPDASESTPPLLPEEKQELLRPELLKQLSLEEYMRLWRRLEPRYFSHVTRQGFRDHFSMLNHSSGIGEHSNGFINILERGASLDTKFGLAGVSPDDPSSIEHFLQDWVLQAPTKAEALARLRIKMEQNPLVNAPQYADHSAVHLAADSVSHRTYGAETQNEAFVVFPTDVIASQYALSQYDHAPSYAEEKHNDVFVWPLEHSPSGIPLEAGIVFLPKSTPVDPATGSKYASVTDAETSRLSLVENEECKRAFLAWTQSNMTNGSDFLQRFRSLPDPFSRLWGSPAFVLRQELRSHLADIGVPHDALDALVTNVFDGAANAVQGLPMTDETTTPEEAAVLWLRRSNAMWARPDTVVSGEEYWNTYFDHHPDKRPARVVYYDGSPNDAVRELLTSHRISDAPQYGTSEFADHIVRDMASDPRANRGKEELMTYARALIDRHYAD